MLRKAKVEVGLSCTELVGQLPCEHQIAIYGTSIACLIIAPAFEPNLYIAPVLRIDTGGSIRQVGHYVLLNMD
jgi:hypothetical protein